MLQNREFDENNVFYCHHCGSKILKSTVICPTCGSRTGFDGSFKYKNKLAAALFAIFLGGLGIHKFYLGKIGQGIVYLLFFWTCIPAIIAFIEGIIYLTMSEDRFQEKYG